MKSYSRETYRTLARPSKGLYKEKGSKFLAFAYPVRTEEEVKRRVEALKKEYFDARHHCYAYRLDPDGSLWRAVDDGEPSSTGGKPILGQLVSHDLSDVLIVVVRYFGGIKLGVGGLTSAYKTAAADALAAAQVVETSYKVPLVLQAPYEELNQLMRVVKQLQLEVRAQDFGGMCTVEVLARPSQAAAIPPALLFKS